MTDRSPDDLTARARIRDAAIQLFAERGIAAATIRDIAQAAGVSSGLVRHHFGSKEALHDVCDAYAKERLDRLREEVFSDGHLAEIFEVCDDLTVMRDGGMPYAAEISDAENADTVRTRAALFALRR